MVNKSKKLLKETFKRIVDLADVKLDVKDKEFWDAIDCLHDEIRDLPNEVGWVLPKERLPEISEIDKNGCVLVTTGGGEVTKVRFNTMTMDFSPEDNVVAWMPVPMPYSDLGKVFKIFYWKK